jgi:GAF domain-containing protein
LRDEYGAVLQDFLNYKGGRGGVVIKREIDNETVLIRNALGATESSILVPGPAPYSPTFVFLSIYGPAAAKLRKSKLPIEKGIAGRVFRSGLAHNSKDVYQDESFSPVADRKGMHLTHSMLTVPIDYQGQIVGVAQFLNKLDGQPFSDSDQEVALRAMQNLASKVSEFRRDPGNFEALGLASPAEEGRQATVLFCDLTASASMYETMRLMQNPAVNPFTGSLARLLRKFPTRLTNTRQRLLRPIERRFLSQTFHDGEAVAVRAYVRTGRRATRRT